MYSRALAKLSIFFLALMVAVTGLGLTNSMVYHCPDYKKALSDVRHGKDTAKGKYGNWTVERQSIAYSGGNWLDVAYVADKDRTTKLICFGVGFQVYLEFPAGSMNYCKVNRADYSFNCNFNVM